MKVLVGTNRSYRVAWTHKVKAKGFNVGTKSGKRLPYRGVTICDIFRIHNGTEMRIARSFGYCASREQFKKYEGRIASMRRALFSIFATPAMWNAFFKAHKEQADKSRIAMYEHAEQ